jgi:hypothetical protein
VLRVIVLIVDTLMDEALIVLPNTVEKLRVDILSEDSVSVLPVMVEKV